MDMRTFPNDFFDRFSSRRVSDDDLDDLTSEDSDDEDEDYEDDKRRV